MDYKRIIKTGEIEYTSFKKEFLLATNPSKQGRLPSDLEKLVKYKDMFTKFDFTIVKPSPNINQYLLSLIDNFYDTNKSFNSNSIADGLLEKN